MLPLRVLSQRLQDSSFRPPGWSQEAWEGKRRQALRLLEVFARHYPGSEEREVFLGFVPGRVEVLGKHTDYAGGHSLLCTLNRGFIVVAARNGTPWVRMVEEEPAFPPLEFPLSADLQPPLGHWGNYPMTMAQRLASNFGAHHPLQGVDVAFTCDLPVGSGMSGSSALMILTFFAIALPNGLPQCDLFRSNVRDGIDLAMYLACAENGQTFRELVGGRGVGTFGGSEDHTAILNGRAGHLSLFQYAPTVPKGEFVWPQDWQFVVAFSGVRAEKTKEALERYNWVSLRARAAVEAYNRAFGTQFLTLREVVETKREPLGAWMNLLRERLVPPPEPPPPGEEWDLPGRVRQFYLEDRRYLPGAVQALLWRRAERWGQWLNASHDASRRWLRNIAPQVHFLQRMALRLGAWGASGFGAGFGGSVYAVVERQKAEEFLQRWSEAYAKQFPQAAAQAVFFLASPSDGVQDWSQPKAGRWVDMAFS